MKLGDRVKCNMGEGIIAGIVPFYIDPVQHPEKINKSEHYGECISQIGGAPRAYESYIVAVPGGFYKTGDPKPDILVWPKNENIHLIDDVEIEEKPVLRRRTRKGK